jgi:ankyrin repeat protein
VQRLVQAGASINGDVAGYSTLREAACAGTAVGVHMIPALVALGARETLGGTVMHNFAASPVEGAPPSDGAVAAALTALVSVDCSLTQPNASGMTPLDWAADTGNEPVVLALLALGVAATAESLAHAVAHPSIVRLLLVAGASAGELVRFVPVDANFTPLMQAAGKAVPESVQLLLGAGASVNALNEQGSTAPMFSVCSKSADAAAVLGVVEALLAAGAAVNALDVGGHTPLHLLAITSHAQPWAAAAARLLLASGADGRVTNNAGKTPAWAVPEAARGCALHRLLLDAAGA